MEWLNYHHLHYFWTVALTGSISKASKELHVSSPAISANFTALKRVWERSYSSGPAAI